MKKCKKIWLHIGDEEGYKRYLLVFKKAFPNFIYRSLDNLEPSSLAEETRDAKSNGMA
jgi:hypothetical protein